MHSLQYSLCHYLKLPFPPPTLLYTASNRLSSTYLQTTIESCGTNKKRRLLTRKLKQEGLYGARPACIH